MDRIDRYVDQVLQVAGLPAHGEQGQELKGHLTDLVAAYTAEGVDEAQAADLAVRELGAPESLGRQLREVTPLRMPVRDWLIILAGAGVAALGVWLHRYFMWGRYTQWYDWEPVTLILAAGVALMVQRPVIGSLAPALGLYLAELSVNLFGWAWRPGDSHMTLIVDPLRLQNPFSVLGPVTVGHPMNAAAGLSYISVCLLIGWGVAKLRRKDNRARPDVTRLAAGIAHLLPFMVLLGLTWGAVGVLLCTAIWYWAKDRQPFGARHALQAAVIGVGAVLTQVLAYQVVTRAWHEPAAITPLWFLAFGVMAVRRVFGAMAIWAALSAFAGHDFRYPFARTLFGGGKWRRFRHV